MAGFVPAGRKKAEVPKPRVVPKSCKVEEATAPLPHVNTRWDHGDAKSYGGGYKLWGDPRVNEFLITYNEKGIN